MSDFTKIAIMHSLIELLEEKEFTKITVKDIVTRCGINRNTFYYHFEDIYDLLGQTFQYLIDQTNLQNINLNNWQEMLEDILQQVEKWKLAGRHIFNSLSTHDLYRYMHEIYWVSFENYFTPIFDEMNVPQDDRIFFLTALTDTMIGFTLEWAEKDFNEQFARTNIQKVAEWLKRILALDPIQ
ncbi:MAG: TetR/AcrR family transcriptional regulator C-terminal domain-containing protein [Absicoccus porci]|jgi:AcrR family transcriptional regulator|uniref:TetR/AcrR family transcriptional regulator n=1 Tax=Absicoccus porci TaxID=2486576 RepID=UPI0024098ECA|nr:TetR/AcrR family transcriptional regulator C-terminal domain-containing protein [Absicoccus porci]MDD6459894.1 TetR/AcrR family transcriptional regulator C-terminal domain-containing protein [Absicoccus porci]MEE1355412.1 TetR/AcrR family transcriptional regulator C-terminal domain-containing protein [Absicoccus porci]